MFRVKFSKGYEERWQKGIKQEIGWALDAWDWNPDAEQQTFKCSADMSPFPYQTGDNIAVVTENGRRWNVSLKAIEWKLWYCNRDWNRYWFEFTRA